jgi:hypothetical protein
MKEVATLLVALEESEHKIRAAVRRGMEATCAIAVELHKIRERELWRARDCNSFNEYCGRYVPLDASSITRIQQIGPVVERLREAGLQLPENESQAAELIPLKPEDQAHVWKRVLLAAEKAEAPITKRVVRDVVAFYQRQQPEPEEDEEEEQQEEEQEETAAGRRGVRTALDLDDKAEAKEDSAPSRGKKDKPKVPERLTFTEKGEAALERIKRLCGKAVGETIEKGNVSISERDLIKWSEETDSMVRNLAYYVIDQRWRVDKAIQFENRTITGETTVADLATIVAARGELSFRFGSIKFSAMVLAAA